MKKRLLSGILSLVMLISTFNLSVLTYADTSELDTEIEAARFNGTNYNYRKTTDLEVDNVPKTNGEADIVLTWPAVDKSGNLINDNPMTSTSLYGDPKGSWTNPVTGMVIAYPNWTPESAAKPDNSKHTGDFQILRGLTDTVTSPEALRVVTIYDDNKAESFFANSYLDTTVVAENFATAYRIEYSLDGTNWTWDHNVTTYNHGKKLNIASTNEKGWEAQKNNTFFLEDQLCENITATTLLPNTEYQVRVLAFNQAEPTSYLTPYKTFTSTFTTPAEVEKTIAFPTVEGGGKYSQGGRGGDVYTVTNLTDSVTNPEPGSLRYGLQNRAKTATGELVPRTIVFAVGGTIHVDPTASKSARRLNIGSNLTIAGQTAPGEGITVAGSSIKIDGEDIIVRYMRFRLGDGYDQDAASASGKNVVIDHCSFGWGVDETFSAKELINSSVQYSIISSGLAMVNKNGINNTDAEVASGESEAKHGMGSILNGYETSFTHNLWAHNGTRNPRFEGSFSYNNTTYTNKMDFSNNVIYNWGHNSSYGGDRGAASVNFTNNYYKPGPNTLAKVASQFMDCDVSSSYGGVKSTYYIDGNYMYNNSEVTADNTLGFRDLATAANTSSTIFEMAQPYTAESAQEAYNNVVASAGASYIRDAHDNRLISEVENGLGSFINSQTEAGGYDSDVYTSTLVDTDGDGMPDDWETTYGLNPNDSSDSSIIVSDEASPFKGYSNLEVYLNDITGDWNGQVITNGYNPNYGRLYISEVGTTNEIDLGTDNVNLELGKSYEVNYQKTADIKNINVYLNDTKFDTTASGGAIIVTPTEVGSYNLNIKFIGEDNKECFAPATPITVVWNNTLGVNMDGFTASEIGATKQAGSVSYNNTTGEMMLQGAGLIGYTASTSAQGDDSFFYNYKPYTGNVEITARVDNLSKIDYFQKAGVMIRGSLEANSEFYMSAVTYLKGEDFEGAKDVSGNAIGARNVKTYARLANGGLIAYGKQLTVPIKRIDLEQNQAYVKVKKVGQTVTTYSSVGGEVWYELNSYTTTLPETFYIGFATDAIQDTCSLVKYNKAIISDISIIEPAANVLLGDVDCDGLITAGDSATLLQYVLDPASVVISEEGLVNAKVNNDPQFTAATVSEISQKALDSSYVFPIEIK